MRQEKEFLEFATALNVSAGGMLLAVRRSLPASTEVSLEIPSAPLAALATLPKVARTLRAKVLRTQHAEAYNLVGLKFSRPLVEFPSPSQSDTKEAIFCGVKIFSLPNPTSPVPRYSTDYPLRTSP